MKTKYYLATNGEFIILSDGGVPIEQQIKRHTSRWGELTEFATKEEFDAAFEAAYALSPEELYQREYDSVIAQRKARYKETDELRVELEYDALSNGIELDLTPWVEAVRQVKVDLPLPVQEA